MYITVSKIIEKYFFILFFLLSFFRSFIFANIKIYIQIKKNNLNNFSRSKLLLKKKSNKLFILGCGQSINDLTEENWNEIKKNDSLGINRWIIHKHVPDFLLFEGAKKSDLLLGEKRNSFIYDVLNESNDRYKNSLYLIKDLDSLYINFQKLKLLQDRILPLYKMIPPGKKLSSIKKSIKYLKKINLLRSVIFPFGHRGSVTHAISLGLNMGYTDIILCGIDLKGPYFWLNNKTDVLYPQELENSEKSEDTHVTNLSENDTVPIEKIIYFIKQNIMKKNQSIYVSSRNSTLSKMFEVYW